MFLLLRDMSTAICDLVLNLLNEGGNISLKQDSAVSLQYLHRNYQHHSILISTESQLIFMKRDVLIWQLRSRLNQKQIHIFAWFAVYLVDSDLVVGTDLGSIDKILSSFLTAFSRYFLSPLPPPFFVAISIFEVLIKII